MKDYIDSLRLAYEAAGYVVGTSNPDPLTCPYCDENPIEDEEDAMTCGRGLCESTYWNEANAASFDA